MIKVTIIDDEPDAVESLSIMLKESPHQIEIIDTANSIAAGIDCLNNNCPQLLFLDVQMPGGSGFDVLRQVAERNFDVIFVTAHNHYAIKAIKYSAVAYLLKPVDIDGMKHLMIGKQNGNRLPAARP